MTATKETSAENMFEETDVPVVTRIGTTKFPNPFFDVVKAMAEKHAKGEKVKALKFNVKHLTDTDDENETIEKAYNRTRRYLTAAGDKAGVTVRAVDNTETDGTVTFWVIDKIVKKVDEE